MTEGPAATVQPVHWGHPAGWFGKFSGNSTGKSLPEAGVITDSFAFGRLTNNAAFRAVVPDLPDRRSGFVC
jgi:hypothetical protein